VPQPVSSADLSQGLLAYEGFDYELPALEASVDSDFVPGATGGSGWAGGWYMAPGVDPMRLGAASLSRGVDVRPGGRIDFAGTSTAGRAMEMAVRMDRDGLYYFSFLFRRQANEDASATDAFMFYLREAGNQTDSSRMLALGVAGAEHLLFVNFRGGGQRVPLPLEYGHTYLLAGKIVAAAWGPDQVFIRVYRTDEPITLQEPASWTLVTQPVVSEEVLDVLSIHVRSLAGESLDELRFAATWAAAVAPWAGPAEYAAQSGGAD
jgi:hypothetical protein